MQDYGSTGRVGSPSSSKRACSGSSSPRTPLSLPQRVLTQATVGLVEPGWPAFWVIVLQDTVAWTFVLLMISDLGATYFNGGSDPCVGPFRDGDTCDLVLGKLSRTSMIFGTISALLCTISGPVTGCLADMVGTKPVLMTSLVLRLGQFFTFAGLAYGRMSIYMYFGAQEVASLVFSGLAFSLWVIENTPPECRVTTIARLQAVLSLEGAVVPIVVMWSPKHIAPLVVMGLGLSSVAIAQFGIPTRRPSAAVTRAVRTKGMASVARTQLSEAWAFLTADGNRIMIAMTILGQCVTVGLGAISYLFLKARFGLVMHDMAKLSAVGSSFFVVVQIFVVPALQPIIGLRHMIGIGMVFGLLTEFLYLVVPSASWLVLALLTNSLASMNGPAVSAMIANLATHGNENGANAALAAANSVNAISFLVGPLVFNGVFSHFLRPNNILFENAWAGAPYALAMVGSATCLVLLSLLPEKLFEKASAARAPSEDSVEDLPTDERSHLA